MELTKTERKTDMEKETTKSRGIGCLTVIGIVFVVLKLLGIQPVAAWSWVWVLAPFWIPIAVAFVLIVIFAILASSRS